MRSAAPACAVVIPSRQRAAELDSLLDALARQTVGRESFEVVVVLDGSTDDSASVLGHWERSRRLPNLRWCWLERGGAARARNAGVDRSAAPIVVFLDDDVVPEPDLLDRHLRHHGSGAAVAVLGDCPVVRDEPRPHLLQVWAWWEDYYADRAAPGRPSTYQDFATGNVSLRRVDFERAGRFDERFERYGGEDFDLGYRLLRCGVEFVTDPSACAPHAHSKDVGESLRAPRDEAAGDVLLGSKYPELRSGLRLASGPTRRHRRLLHLAYAAPRLADAWDAVRCIKLEMYERLGLRGRWRRTFTDLRTFAYWRGVLEVLGSWHELRRFQEGASRPRWILDLSDGLPAELPPVGRGAASEVDVSVDGTPVGTVTVPAWLSDTPRNVLASLIARQLGPEVAQHVTRFPTERDERHRRPVPTAPAV